MTAQFGRGHFQKFRVDLAEVFWTINRRNIERRIVKKLREIVDDLPHPYQSNLGSLASRAGGGRLATPENWIGLRVADFLHKIGQRNTKLVRNCPEHFRTRCLLPALILRDELWSHTDQFGKFGPIQAARLPCFGQAPTQESGRSDLHSSVPVFEAVLRRGAARSSRFSTGTYAARISARAN